MTMDDQQYILRWHHHESTLLSGLPQLLESETFTDITLSAGCGHVKAHRLVLAMCSTYFLELFQDMPQIQHPIVILKDIDYSDLCCLMSFMYRGHCKVDASRLANLLTTAKVLRIRGLCDMQLPSLSTPSPAFLPQPEVEKINECDLNGNVYPLSEPTKTISKPIRNAQPMPTECQICGKQLSNQYNLRVHLETHENGQHACTVCPHVSRSRDALRKHVSYRHPELTETVSPPRKRNKTASTSAAV